MFRKTDFIEAFQEELKKKMYLYIEPMNKGGGSAENFYIFSQIDQELRVARVYKESYGVFNKDRLKQDTKKLRGIEHKNIVKIFEIGFVKYNDDEYFFQILENIKGNDLEEIDTVLFLDSPYEERVNLFNQTLAGVDAFRENFEKHSDLHLGNIVLSKEITIKERRIKIIDPGSSRYSYIPKDEDSDLFYIKEAHLDFFFTTEEKKKLFGEIDLESMPFSELKKRIMNELYKYSEEDLEQHNHLQEILKNIDFQADQELRRDKKLLRIQSDKYKDKNLILIGFNVYPLNKNKQIIDIKNEEFERFIENLWKRFNFQYPTSSVYFSQYLKENHYLENRYIFDFEDINSSIYDYSKIIISEDGHISVNVIFSTMTFKENHPFESRLIPEAKRGTLENSYLLRYTHLPFFFILSLYLVKLTLRQANFDGNIKVSSHILSNNNLSLFFGHPNPLSIPKVSNKIDIKFHYQINLFDLDYKENVNNMTLLYLKEILKHFNTKVDERKELLKNFDGTINNCIEFIFL